MVRKSFGVYTKPRNIIATINKNILIIELTNINPKEKVNIVLQTITINFTSYIKDQKKVPKQYFCLIC